MKRTWIMSQNINFASNSFETWKKLNQTNKITFRLCKFFYNSWKWLQKCEFRWINVFDNSIKFETMRKFKTSSTCRMMIIFLNCHIIVIMICNIFRNTHFKTLAINNKFLFCFQRLQFRTLLHLYKTLNNLYSIIVWCWFLLDAHRRDLIVVMFSFLSDHVRDLVQHYFDFEKSINYARNYTNVSLRQFQRMHKFWKKWDEIVEFCFRFSKRFVILQIEHHIVFFLYFENRSTTYLNEMTWYFFDEYDIIVDEFIIWKFLQRLRWTKKRFIKMIKKRNAYFRVEWFKRLENWTIYQMMFLNESLFMSVLTIKNLIENHETCRLWKFNFSSEIKDEAYFLFLLLTISLHIDYITITLSRKFTTISFEMTFFLNASTTMIFETFSSWITLK